MTQVSEIEIVLVKPQNGLIGFSSFLLDNKIYFSSVAIHSKINGGFRLTYPTKNGFTLFYPVNRTTSKAIEQAVFEKLKNVMNLKNDRYCHTLNTAG